MSAVIVNDLEPIIALEQELDRLIEKFTEIREIAAVEISDKVSLLQMLMQMLSKEEQEITMDTDDRMANEAAMPYPPRMTDSQVSIITNALQQTNKKLQHLSSEHRDLHGTLSKVGKIIDRNFVSDFTAIASIDVLQDEENIMLLNKVVAKHYSRQGMDDVAKLLIKESKMPETMAVEVLESERTYKEIYRISKALQQHELGPALEWTSRYSNELIAKNSILEFLLHRLRFLQIISKGISAQAEALAYARSYFHKFVGRCSQEIGSLMHSFLCLTFDKENSQDKNIISPEMWTQASNIYLRDACHTLGIRKNSALSDAVNVGCTTLPVLLNIKEVMQSRKDINIWNGRNEMPIEIDLDTEYHYHTFFTCPILREQTTEENPPMKLPCGHVISNDALERLRIEKMICPYCMEEQNAKDAVRVYF